MVGDLCYNFDLKKPLFKIPSRWATGSAGWRRWSGQVRNWQRRWEIRIGSSNSSRNRSTGTTTASGSRYYPHPDGFPVCHHLGSMLHYHRCGIMIFCASSFRMSLIWKKKCFLAGSQARKQFDILFRNLVDGLVKGHAKPGRKNHCKSLIENAYA